MGRRWVLALLGAAAGNHPLRCPPERPEAKDCVLEQVFPDSGPVDFFKLMDFHRFMVLSRYHNCSWLEEPNICLEETVSVVAMSELACGVYLRNCYTTEEWAELVTEACRLSGCASTPQATLLQLPKDYSVMALSECMANIGSHSVLLQRMFSKKMRPEYHPMVVQDPVQASLCPVPKFYFKAETPYQGMESMVVDYPGVELIVAELVREGRLGSPAVPDVINLGAGHGGCRSGEYEYDPANCLFERYGASGLWVEGSPEQSEKLVRAVRAADAAKKQKLHVVTKMIDEDKLLELIGLVRDAGDLSSTPNLLKIDLDNCDCRLAEAILKRAQLLPQLVFVEINLFWAPPVRTHCQWTSEYQQVPQESFGAGCSLQDYADALGPAYRLLFVDFNNALFAHGDLLAESAGVSRLVARYDGWTLHDHWLHGFWCRPMARYFAVPFDINYSHTQDFEALSHLDIQRFFLLRWAGLADAGAAQSLLTA